MARKITYKDAPDALVKMSVPSVDNNSNRASIGMNEFFGEYYFIDVDRLIPFKGQSRVHFDEKEIESLAQTIKEHGIRQPLSIIKSTYSEDKFEIVSGERRLRAAKLAGLMKVPCIILSKTASVDEIALVENVQRSDLHPLELAKGLKKLMDQYQWGGQVELEKKLGIPQSRISEHLKILELSEVVQSFAIDHNFDSLTNLLSLIKLDNDDERIDVINGSRKNKRDALTFSVVRLFYKQSSLCVQKNGIKNLTDEQKQDVKKSIIDILNELG